MEADDSVHVPFSLLTNRFPAVAAIARFWHLRRPFIEYLHSLR
jgi:hypothetical protein